MGRSRVWPYRIEWVVAGQRWSHTEWRVRPCQGCPGMGRPTDVNLAKEVRAVVDSFRPGGSNYRDGQAVPTILSARVVDQRTGDVAATWQDAALATPAL
jgi:hypothetical protein